MYLDPTNPFVVLTEDYRTYVKKYEKKKQEVQIQKDLQLIQMAESLDLNNGLYDKDGKLNILVEAEKRGTTVLKTELGSEYVFKVDISS